MSTFREPRRLASKRGLRARPPAQAAHPQGLTRNARLAISFTEPSAVRADDELTIPFAAASDSDRGPFAPVCACLEDPE